MGQIVKFRSSKNRTNSGGIIQTKGNSYISVIIPNAYHCNKMLTECTAGVVAEYDREVVVVRWIQHKGTV